jgi:hypothetical protein
MWEGKFPEQQIQELTLRLIHEVPLHDSKIDAWCRMRIDRITGQIFFDDTINSERNTEQILCPFFEKLTGEELFHVLPTRLCYYTQCNGFHGRFGGNVWEKQFVTRMFP